MSPFAMIRQVAITLAFAGAAHAQEHVHQHETPPASTQQNAAPTHDEHQHEHAPAPESTASPEEANRPTQSESEHVAPEPPASDMPNMSYREMTDLMTMDDRAAIGKVLAEQLEWRNAKGSGVLGWDAQAYYGTDYNKLWLRTEGEHTSGKTEDARAELLWDRIFSRWWSSQIGVRHDFGEGPSRDWLAVGVQGLAPYFFDIEATAYVADAGRTAARFKARYEALFTQRLILEPELELNAYGKDDPERRVMSGLSDLQLGLRLRYEIRREFAPYVGVTWVRRLGRTADLVRAAGEDASDLQALAGVRFWF
jgi:copper resistance protein B